MDTQKPRVAIDGEHKIWLIGAMIYVSALFTLDVLTWIRFAFDISPPGGYTSAREGMAGLPGGLIGLLVFGTVLQAVTIVSLIRRVKLATAGFFLLALNGVIVLGWLISINYFRAEEVFDNSVIGIICAIGLGIWSIIATRRGVLT
ncbi:MAG: hypothetical protein Alpg2KO_29940 [Alphaproteobacteria bacterium]